MLSFSSRPPDNARSAAVLIVRCPAARELILQVSAENLLGTSTHFANGRTAPCTLPECPACTDGIPWRWHAYLACYDWSKNHHVLLELTAAGSEPLIAYHDEHGTLRGRFIRVTRPSHRPNGRTALQIRAAKPTEPAPPNAPDVRRALCLLWSLPFTAVHQPGLTRGIPALDARGDEIDRLIHAPPNPTLLGTPPLPNQPIANRTAQNPRETPPTNPPICPGKPDGQPHN